MARLSLANRKPWTIGVAGALGIAVIGGVVGGVVASSGSPPSHKATTVIQRTASTGTTGTTGNTGSVTTTTLTPQQAATSAGQSAQNAAGSAASAAQSATSAKGSADSASSSAQAAQQAAGQAEAAAGSTPTTDPAPTTTTTPTTIALPTETTIASINQTGPASFSVTLNTVSGVPAPTGSLTLQGDTDGNDPWFCTMTLSGGSGNCTSQNIYGNGVSYTFVNYAGDSNYRGFTHNVGSGYSYS